MEYFEPITCVVFVGVDVGIDVDIDVDVDAVEIYDVCSASVFTTLLVRTCPRTAVASGRERLVRYQADLARPRCLRSTFKTQLGFPNYRYYE